MGALLLAPGAQAAFTATTTALTTETAPVGIVTADLDSDGRLDIASANRGANSLTVQYKNVSAAATPPRACRRARRPSRWRSACSDAGTSPTS